MKHLKRGEFQALLDGALEVGQQAQMQAHLAQCPRCKAQMERLQERHQQVQQALTALQPGQSIHSAPAAAQQRLQTRLNSLEQEKQPMWQKFFRRLPAQTWAGLAAILILGIALAFPSVRAAADSFLGLFRVQRIQVIPIDEGNLPGNLGNSRNLETMFSQNIQVVEDGQLQIVPDAATAAALAGFPVRLPQALEGSPSLQVQPGGTVTFQLDLELMRAILRDLERPDIPLPDSLDGAVVTVQVPASVMAQYGRCQPAEGAEEPGIAENTCTTLVQVPSPTVSAPPELDMVQIGVAYLQLLGMERQEAEQFARHVDWSSTFVIPIPRYSSRVREVNVDGVTGTLIERYQEYLLLWVKDGIVYALSGQGNYTTALRIAGSLE